jgi:S-adenosylmethionine uptake transporter
MNIKNYLLGVSWFILHLFCSTANDIISKYVGGNLHSFEVSFFRFFFSALGLVPFILYQGVGSIKSYNLFVHIIRGVLLFFGITAWTYGLSLTHVSTATVISFSIPIFTLLMAVFFLEEKIIWQRWLVTFIGFIGIFATLRPDSQDFNPQVLIFVVAAISFAALDIINKKFVVEESMISMLFYSSVVTAALSVPPAIYYWQTPTLHDLFLLFILGAVSANLILFFLLKAFALVDATAIAPYRYLELLISSITSYFVFGDLPPKANWYGAAILIPSTLFIVYSESRGRKDSKTA